MNNLYLACKQRGIPAEYHREIIDIYLKFVAAGLSPDFYSLLNILDFSLKGNRMEGLTEGRIVHYVLQTGPSHGQHRPAMIVKVWNKETGIINLTVFADWENDGVADSSYWATSVKPDEETKSPGTWHWIERA